MTFRSTLILAALLFAAVGSGVLLLREQPDDPAANRAPRLGVGYFMNDAELTGTGQDGSILYKVKAKTASQQLGQADIALEQIRMVYGPGGAARWDLRARSGRIPPDGDIIELAGNVIAVGQDADRPATTIRTEFLEVNPERAIAETDRKVTIEYTGNEVLATGMRADFREDRLRLLSNVNGKFIQ